jgi:catechol 2,3-dioxygenase-like lactoylglutathione lyase family enzyme
LRITHFTVLVEDIDAAVNFYVEKLGFEKRADTIIWVGTRWVTVSPKGQPEIELSFAHADEDCNLLVVGKQSPNIPLMFLETDDLQRDYNVLKAKGVHFRTYPTEQAWGTEAVFEDLYGNLINLVQPPKTPLG